MLPERLSALERLAYNLWWSWDTDAWQLWSDVDSWRWERCRHNPVALLRDVEKARWEELAASATFCHRLDDVAERFDEYVQGDTWCRRSLPKLADKRVAYLSMEFGLHESLRIYSGGLGVLAGDHLRSASDLGVPIVGVGLLYRQGYFRQLIDDGRQIPAYPGADFTRLPLQLLDETVTVDIGEGHAAVEARIWRLDVGRCRLYLLDADHDGNDELGRSLTYHLYGGDAETRIRQEVLLGIGGVKALRLLGESPDILHLNEGHCAFAVLELMRPHLESGSSLDEALQAVRHRVVFTTHTPVPAGHDRFQSDLVDAALGRWRDDLKLASRSLMDLGRVTPGDAEETLCMTVVALRAANASNGVSELHGAVSRRMWHAMWPDGSADDVPIGHVTNGVHPIFWMSGDAREIYDRYAPEWRDHLWDEQFWADAVASIPDEALWNMRYNLRARLVKLVRMRTGMQLNPNALTIGFARRFAPYKRGDLLFSDPKRALRILNHTQPVQIVYAGKAHPRDLMGQDIVRRVVRWGDRREFRGRVAFLEDYDIRLGAALTSGSDLWLNNPRRPNEASGTSGQKVPLNGGINLSVLDGWWPECHDGTNGWTIGEGREWTDTSEQDAFDADSLYRVLEEQILPLWADRTSAGIPRRWLKVVRRSIATCVPQFNSHRMVRDYARDMYEPQLQ